VELLYMYFIMSNSLSELMSFYIDSDKYYRGKYLILKF